MSQINLKSVGRTDPELKQLLQAAINNNARIFAIIMEGDAGSERSINYRFSQADSAAILNAIQAVLSPKLAKIDLATAVIQANADSVVAQPVALDAGPVKVGAVDQIAVVAE